MALINNKLIVDKSFFGKINCFKVQMNREKEVYFHIGIERESKWNWIKVKMSDMEMGEMIHLLNQKVAKCSFFHSFKESKTQIWCNKSETGFSIKIKDISKNLSIGEAEVLKIILNGCIQRRLFT
jgi:hypothetical protein